MFKRKLPIFLVLVLIINCCSLLASSGKGRAATIHHVGPGQQYNGTSSAVIQQAINAANAGDIIWLHEAQYNISGPILLKSGLTLRGDGINKTIIYGGPTVCTTYSNDAYVRCYNISNVEIYGITFKSASAGPHENGKGDLYRYCISARNCSNIKIHDCSAPKWIYNDFFRASYSTGLEMYNCDIVTGHTGGYFYNCSDVKAYNNRILVYTNAGLRGDNTYGNVKFYNNTIWCEASSGQAAFEFQNNCNGVEMHHNLVYDFSKAHSYHCVVQNWQGSAYGNVVFRDNVYWNCSGGVEIGSGTGNIIDPSNRNVAYWESIGYGCQSTEPLDPDAWYSGTSFTSVHDLGSGNTGSAVTIEFDVIPLYSNTSGVIGYADSSTTISSFSDMAMIISLEADGYFYARNGGSYAKDANVSFSAGNTYHVRIVANMTAKTYDVFVTPQGGSQVQIANDYAFRTGSPPTDDVGKVCLNSATTNPNDFKVKNHTVTGPSWYSGTNFSSQKNLGSGNTGTAVTVEFDVTPQYSNTSGVIGYADSSTTISSFSDMAMIISLEADGYFYARNGGSYAKDANVSFSAGNTYHVRIVANMTAKTYDVFVTPQGGSQVQIANDYAFRTGSPPTDDVGKVCLNSATTNPNDFKVDNHVVTPGSLQPVTFNPTADAFVRGGSFAENNYGSDTSLEVKQDTNQSYVRKSYLKFNFSSISGSTIQQAKLRFYVSSTEGDASTFNLYGNATENWSESTIKWNNAPAPTTFIGSINISATGGQWYEIDVTNYVNNHMSDKLVSFELINEGPYTTGNRTFINSREASGNQPQLVITP